MRFRLCGGLEPPDWLLADAPLLSRLPPAAAADLCATIACDVAAAPGQDALATAEALLGGDPTAARAALAALRFVLTSAAKYDVGEADVRMELQQLGLGQALSAAVAQSLAASRAPVRTQQRVLSFSFAHPEAVACAARRSAETQQPMVEVRLRLDAPATVLAGAPAASDTEVFTARADKFLALEEDLRHALSTIQSVRL